MRVIAGTLKGRRLKGPSWEGLRPTSDRLRETLFNVLAPRIVGARVLDGYAGTGAVGIEALSRGATHVTFVDDDRRAQSLVAENLAHCGVRNGYVIIPAGLARALSALRADAAFDIILLDPPYDQLKSRREMGGDREVQAVVAAAGERLAPGGILVVEHARRIAAPDSAGSVVRTRELVAGDSGLAFYELQRQ
jgi:16S rRNA (guanine(966)-N(2))-methyltransferase RsmD